MQFQIYHHNKNLFSSEAVQKQTERITLLLALFRKELKKTEITLTPQMLYDKLIEKHPTYTLLKSLDLSDINFYESLGYFPENIYSDAVIKCSKYIKEYNKKAIEKIQDLATRSKNGEELETKVKIFPEDIEDKSLQVTATLLLELEELLEQDKRLKEIDEALPLIE